MSATEFEELLGLVGPAISKQYVVRDPISAPERLALTLRFISFRCSKFLASGDSMTSSLLHIRHRRDTDSNPR
ncbi:hypothetical protein ALC57_08894 [Trachymyrmex cornetzi]|uniref:Uncharacterized protein n=1 Tax=Trachymyrmex cornetzi TaxID=471704 RepID=A0A151J6H9_9HYME|nr:hypothetical protein ALC57_08894 [Trachymyrmex cornetzi]